MSTLIEIKNLVKHYGDVHAVNNLSLSIPRGICFGLLGPNGAGKSTTIEIAEGILQPTSGEIAYKGQPLGDKFREEAGIQFQATALQEFLTVKETIKMFYDLYDKTMPWDELISLCNLDELLGRDNKHLSGGQRQRLLLALALVNDPEVLFLDEPTTGLDPQARRNFWDLVKLIRARNKTIVLTTHYMDEAYELCDEIVIVDKGEIIAQGTPQSLLKNHFGETVIQLPDNVLTDQHAQSLGLRYVIRNNWTEIQTTNAHETIKQLLNADISLSQLRLREWSLEDLFIALTGKQLRH
ncbi:MAG: ABC transporter ATP-binding protein [Gammaproteobacteria bacterium]|nr:ABC transporter ATP-binding protein [Gammaproteobacteria bacterium]